MIPTPNSIQQGQGFHISYNDVDHAIYGCDTTALVIGQMQRFHILNGDHRRQYREIIAEGLETCLAYFHANGDVINHRSDPDNVDVLLRQALDRLAA